MNNHRGVLWIVAGICLSALAWAQNAGQRPKTDWLVPRLHFIHGDSSSDPVRLYFERTMDFTVQKLEIKGLRVKGWGVVMVGTKSELEITLGLKPGDDVEFDHVQITDAQSVRHTVFVGPNRVLYLKPQPEALGLERLESAPGVGMYLGMQVFNTTDAKGQARDVTILGLEYAPKAISTRHVLLQPRFDPAWFGSLEDWANANVSDPRSIPSGNAMMDSSAINLTVRPSRGFSVAVIEASLRHSCLRKLPEHTRTQAYWQPVIKYRVGQGPAQWYPLPSPVLADLCLN